MLQRQLEGPFAKVGMEMLLHFPNYGYLCFHDTFDEFFTEENGKLSNSDHIRVAIFHDGMQNVPPAILLRFLREHKSEWADSGIDAYSAAAVKSGPCNRGPSRMFWWAGYTSVGPHY